MEVLSKSRLATIRKKLEKYSRMKGGRTYVLSKCKLSTKAYYRCLQGEQIRLKTALILEEFFQNEKINKAKSK